MNLIIVWQALKKGKELKNVTGWKNFQITTTLVGGLLASICYLLPLFGVDIVVSEEMLDNIAKGISSVLVLLNAYLIPATTKKTGLGKMPVENKEPKLGVGD